MRGGGRGASRGVAEMWRDGLVGAPNAGMIGTSLSTGLMTSAVCGTASSHDRGASMYQMHRSTAHPPRTPWKGFACTGTPLRSATSGLPSALHASNWRRISRYVSTAKTAACVTIISRICPFAKTPKRACGRSTPVSSGSGRAGAVRVAL